MHTKFHCKDSRYSSRLIWLAAFILIYAALFPVNEIPVDYRNRSDYDIIRVSSLDGVDFFNINELNKVFNAYISRDINDHRIFVDIFGQRLIFLLGAAYVVYESEMYNFVHNIRTVEGRDYLPVIFLQKVLPAILPDKISYNGSSGRISAVPPVDTSLRTIVIDPGHGGKDPGAVGFSRRNYEKDIVLAVAKQIKEIVEKNLDVRVLLTREDDRFKPLQQRTAYANSSNANLFISLHCNAAPNRAAQGIEVFFLSAARTDEARAVELMENSVVELYEGEEAVKMYDDLTFILMDMAQAEQLRESSYLAIKLQANLVSKTGAVDRGVKQAGFYVLRGAYMPSVLVELGFISNQQEERKLIQQSYQRTLAEAVYEGIKSYIHNYEMFR